MAQIVRTTSRVVLGGSAALLLTLLLAGCDHGSTGPQLGTPAQFSRIISLPDLHTQLSSGAARVDVRVTPGGLIARRVEIKGADELTRPEEIRSRVTAISASGDQGTVTLALGGLQIGFNASTTFRPDDGKGEDGGSMALADFVARVQMELAAGGHPAVKARRSPPTQPQAPGDAAFMATQLKLDHEADHPVIKLNMTADNLITNQTPPPDGWVKVLGLMIELRVTSGDTKLQAEMPDVEDEHEFEGLVQSVDATAGTVTLKSGTIIRIVAGTEIEGKEGEGDEHLASLADVQAALAAGKTVKAEGEGLVTAATPLTIDAIEIEFAVEEVEEAPAPQPGAAVGFRDMVATVDVAHSSFTLGDGSLVKVTDKTTIDPSGDLHTLQAVSDALAAHQMVRAEGHATVDAAGPPPTLTASDVKFETH